MVLSYVVLLYDSNKTTEQNQNDTLLQVYRKLAETGNTLKVPGVDDFPLLSAAYTSDGIVGKLLKM